MVDWVIVEVGAKGGCLTAFDKRTGERRWASEYGGPAGHTGGLVPITVERVPCVAVLTLNDLLVARLDKGNEGKYSVAAYPWKSAWANNVLTPAGQGDCVLISSRHTHKSICKGKITLRGAQRLWEQPVLLARRQPRRPRRLRLHGRRAVAVPRLEDGQTRVGRRVLR